MRRVGKKKKGAAAGFDFDNLSGAREFRILIEAKAPNFVSHFLVKFTPIPGGEKGFFI